MPPEVPMLRRLAIALAILTTGAGCMPKQTLRDTTTIHNHDATRIWIVQGLGDDQFVVFCDAPMYAQTKVLCVRWPAAFVPVPGAIPVPPTPPASPP